MPKAFANAGWLIASVLIGILCLMSFITSTFMVEAMAAANAMLRLKAREKSLSAPIHPSTGSALSAGSNGEKDSSSDDPDENVPLLINALGSSRGDLYDISKRVEMGQMANLFFSKLGVRLFYFCIVLYLYGDLAIYAAAVPKSLTKVTCGSWNETDSTKSNNKTCPGWGSVTQGNVYRVFLAIFTVTLGPFAFFNVQKTKYLQIFTTLMRWVAFIMMIVIAVVKIGKGQGEHDTPTASISGLPNLFGVCVYSYMCQHSLPSLITPMKNKSRITLLFVADFAIVLIFYALLSFTAIFAFRSEDLNDLYTLNFRKTSGSFVGYFLALFPVFTLSTNFPIISITLRDNLKNLFHREGRPYPWVVDRIVFPLSTITLPIIVAFITQNLEILVGVTGSYAGTGVQYVIPACLAYFGKKQLTEMTGRYDNKHKSPFGWSLWIVFVIGWAFVCIGLVTVNHIIAKK